LPSRHRLAGGGAGAGQGLTLFIPPHPEERALARVSKDEAARLHPSRRREDAAPESLTEKGVSDFGRL
jgi:hypothetical protein